MAIPTAGGTPWDDVVSIPTTLVGDGDYVDGDSKVIIGDEQATSMIGRFNTATLIDIDTDTDALIAGADGARLVIDYYSQALGSNDSVANLELDLNETLQQYNKITGLEVRVTDAITTGLATDIGGSLTILTGVVPQDKDIFVMTILGNKRVLMTITNVVKSHYNNNIVYAVTFALDSYVDLEPEKYRNLLDKVIKNYFYNKDYYLTGSNPVLLSSDFIYHTNVKDVHKHMMSSYMRDMIDYKSNMLIIPSQNDVKIGDPFLEHFLFKIIPNDGSNPFHKIQRISQDLDLISNDNVWMGLMNRDKYGVMSSRLELKLVNMSGISIPASFSGPLIERGVTTGAVDVNILPIHNEVDNTYLFTTTFYDNPASDELSFLEKLVWQYLNSEVLDKDMLSQLIATYRFWSKFERFYYVPVMMLLLASVGYNVRGVR